MRQIKLITLYMTLCVSNILHRSKRSWSATNLWSSVNEWLMNSLHHFTPFVKSLCTLMCYFPQCHWIFHQLILFYAWVSQMDEIPGARLLLYFSVIAVDYWILNWLPMLSHTADVEFQCYCLLNCMSQCYRYYFWTYHIETTLRPLYLVNRCSTSTTSVAVTLAFT